LNFSSRLAIKAHLRLHRKFALRANKATTSSLKRRVSAFPGARLPYTGTGAHERLPSLARSVLGHSWPSAHALPRSRLAAEPFSPAFGFMHIRNI